MPRSRRRTSLRRRWDRAFTFLLLLVLGGGVASTFTVTHLTRSARASAQEIEGELDASRHLRTALDHAEGTFRQLLDERTAAARTELNEADASIRGLLTKLAEAFDDRDERPVVARVRVLWQREMDLFGTETNSGAAGTDPGAQLSFGAVTHGEIDRRVEATLDALQTLEAAGGRELDQQLAEGRHAERRQLTILYTVLLTSLVATAYFALLIHSLIAAGEPLSPLGVGPVDEGRGPRPSRACGGTCSGRFRGSGRPRAAGVRVSSITGWRSVAATSWETWRRRSTLWPGPWLRTSAV